MANTPENTSIQFWGMEEFPNFIIYSRLVERKAEHVSSLVARLMEEGCSEEVAVDALATAASEDEDINITIDDFSGEASFYRNWMLN